ncbi:MAG: hypothetical protein KDI06_01625 [Calditrichaeota bacterium]|nr:hypothetical protein [Calditrichota bacterium]HQU70685.1 hypothetical protein [Calditrichia bacterium]
MQRSQTSIFSVKPPFKRQQPAKKSTASRQSTVHTHSFSPLWLVAREPLVNELIGELKLLQNELIDMPDLHRELFFSRSRVSEVRQAFWETIRRGEERLHQLSGLLGQSLLQHYQMESVVIGEIDTTGERFSISQNISEKELYASTDLDLGNRQLGKLRFFDGRTWSGAGLVANVVEYLPTQSNPFNIHRIISRIKAEEEIWNKVVDEIFDLDNLVKRDKTLCHLSRYVKDIFGIKLVVGNQSDVHRLQDFLENLAWEEATLKKFKLDKIPDCKRMTMVEKKDYLSRETRKQSGWEALKSVVHWGDKTFEIQIQPLRNFLRERELLTRESHDSFRAHREQIRQQISQQIPLFGFYRELLRWLFQSPESTPPTYHGLTLHLID